MDRKDVPLKLPVPTIDPLRRIAQQEDASAGQVIREALSRDLLRLDKAKTLVMADKRLVASLRALLANDFAFASDWGDLDRKLGHKSYWLTRAGNGLILTARQSGERICKRSELGWGYSLLLRRFRATIPEVLNISFLDRARSAADSAGH